MIWLVLAFAGGVYFGMLLLALMIAAKRADDTREREPSKTACELSEIVRETSDREAADCLHGLQYTLHEIEGVKADIEWAMKALGRMLQHDAGDDEPTPIELTEEEWEAAVEWAPEGAARRMVRNVTLTAIDAINEMREQL